MPSLNDPAARASLVARLDRLSPDALPFPKNAPTAPEIIARAPEAFDVEKANAKALLTRLGGHVTYAVHPIFGTLSRSEWGALSYKHFDHHLRQFGV
jgi:Protein of unknown function (DUF1569)